MKQELEPTTGAMLVLVILLAMAGAAICFASKTHLGSLKYGQFIEDCVENRSMAAAECDALYEAQQDVVARKNKPEYSAPAESGVR
jgi:hypothetical protein